MGTGCALAARRVSPAAQGSPEGQDIPGEAASCPPPASRVTPRPFKQPWHRHWGLFMALPSAHTHPLTSAPAPPAPRPAWPASPYTEPAPSLAPGGRPTMRPLPAALAASSRPDTCSGDADTSRPGPHPCALPEEAPPAKAPHRDAQPETQPHGPGAGRRASAQEAAGLRPAPTTPPPPPRLPRAPRGPRTPEPRAGTRRAPPARDRAGRQCHGRRSAFPRMRRTPSPRGLRSPRPQPGPRAPEVSGPQAPGVSSPRAPQPVPARSRTQRSHSRQLWAGGLALRSVRASFLAPWPRSVWPLRVLASRPRRGDRGWGAGSAGCGWRCPRSLRALRSASQAGGAAAAPSSTQAAAGTATSAS